MERNSIKTRIARIFSVLTVAAFVAVSGGYAASAADQVRVSGLTWPGYGFWFIVQEKNLAPDLEITYQAIEDPFESFALASSGQLDIVYSTIEFAPIAASEGFPIKLVAYGNLSHGTDKIIVGPGIESAEDLRGQKVAVLEGGLAQLYMAIWLESNGVAYDEVEYVNLIMDDAASAMIGGDVKAAEFWEPFGANTLAAVEGSKIMATSADEQWEKNALMADALFMSDAFINDNREVALKAMQALYDAIQWWKENPTEGNEIIARGMQMTVEDVELVIGADGTCLDGGLCPYTFIETARFCGAAPGDPPFGQTNGQMADHFRMTNDWWIKFGLMTETFEPEAGVDCSLLADLYESGYGQ
ncbi:MAG: ABC transporter substrate-binding protein [Dongiaceae bacterium]